MIGKLRGKIVEVTGNMGLIETQSGVFYEVFLTPQLITSHQSIDVIEVYTYLQVRDDALVLFGFKTKKINGHNEESLSKLKNLEEGLNAIIFDTIKGKGVKCLEEKHAHGYKWTEEEKKESLEALSK